MINKALRISREFHRLKQKDLADRLGISPSYLSEIETGNKTPSLDLLEKYGKIFNVPPSTFLVFAEKSSGLCSSDAVSKNARRLLKFFEWVIEDEHDDNLRLPRHDNGKEEKVTA